jgi:hypothetical protein
METRTKVLHWIPRILCILAILFISMFALDAFEPGLTIWHQILAFLKHLIPSFILIALLIVAWKWELIGGIVFTMIGIAMSPLIFVHNYRMNNSIWMSIGIIMTITIPFVLVGILFIISHSYKRKQIPT